MKTSGNTILVTGGTSGIGLGLGLRWHAAGNTVVVAGRRTRLLEKIATDNPGVQTLELDVADPGSIAAAAALLGERWPELNVLVNNAGIMDFEDLTDANSLELAERTVVTNLLGPRRMLAALLPGLLTRPDPVVVSMTSGLAFVPLPATPTYNATKAALHSLTESLRVQLAGTAGQVIEIAPPAVRTTLLGQQEEESSMPLEEFLDEVMAILAAEPGVEQVLVERVRPLRFAEATGTYPTMLTALSGH